MANGTSTRFQHRPLIRTNLRRQIRLVNLLPRTEGGLIQCTIRHEDLDKRHFALSYVWGEPTPTRDILIDGKTFTIRENLWHFLARQDERDRSTRSYWIDQICINQEDVAEKNAQVGIMGKIYGNAKEVLVWLGSAEEEIVRAMGKANYSSMSTLAEWYDKYSDKLFAPRTTNRICSRMEAEIGGRKRLRHLFTRLVNNNYWARAWTVQEFVLARDLKVISGTSSINSRCFFNACCALSSYRDSRHDDLIPFVQGRVMKRKAAGFRTRRRKSSLYSLLVLAQDQPGICEKQVDSIYSLLGLVEGQCFVEPDYNLSARTLCRQIFICEWDMKFSPSPEIVAELIAKRLGLDPEQEWKHLLRFLGLEAGSSYEEVYQDLQRAVEQEKFLLWSGGWFFLRRSSESRRGGVLVF